jgi:hypothetical protein
MRQLRSLCQALALELRTLDAKAASEQEGGGDTFQTRESRPYLTLLSA